MSHSFDALVLLTSIPSKTLILSKYSIFMNSMNIDIHLRKLVDNICYFHENGSKKYYHAMTFYSFI